MGQDFWRNVLRSENFFQDTCCILGQFSGFNRIFSRTTGYTLRLEKVGEKENLVFVSALELNVFQMMWPKGDLLPP